MQQAADVKAARTGTVKWFNTEKGYGFITSPEGEDVFVHYRAIQSDGYKNLKEGQHVEYLQIKSAKGWQAAEVVPGDLPDAGYEDYHQDHEVNGNH